MRKIFSILGMIVLIVLILAACGAPASAPVLPQLSRAEQLAPSGLLNSHEFVGSVEAVVARCDLAAVPESEKVLARLDWTDQTGKKISTVVDCLKVVVKHDATVSTANIKFVFDQNWLRDVPVSNGKKYGLDTVEFIILPGELGKTQDLAVTVVDGVVTYDTLVLADPNNFIRGYWLEKVVITVP